MVSLGTSVQSAYDPWAIQDRVGLADARLALDSVLMPRPNLSYLDYRSGVMASGDTAGVGGSSHMAMRVRPGSGLTVTVEMGNCIINTSGQGAYMCALDSKKTLILAGSSSTTNRIDLIVARVYDDNNAAIASPPGVRKFCVEVWQGDPATGTPVIPTPTPTAGWTPLAAVAVSKNVGSLSTTDITDLRGPGLVARGGMRALYGDDAKVTSGAFAEPGAYPGDARWVHTSGFQHQVYYGAGSDPANSGWRGVQNCLQYRAAAPPGALVWTTGPVATREICRVHIPYPGTPYFVYPSARAQITMTPDSSADLVIRSSPEPTQGVQGGGINWTRFHTFGATANRVQTPNVAPMHYGVYVTATDIILHCAMRDTPSSSSGFAFSGDDIYTNILDVMVYPSTIQPPAV